MQALASPRGAFSPGAFRPRRSPAKVSALFGFGKGREKSQKELEKDEAFQAQQEVLARRRSGIWQQEVKERRGKVSRYLNDPEFKKQVDEDKRARFKAKMAEEAEQYTGFRPIIPILPIGLPDYDIGEERFDLRLPYADKGWEDEELAGDHLGLRQLGKAFGFGKDKKKQAPADKGSSSGGKRKGGK